MPYPSLHANPLCPLGKVLRRPLVNPLFVLPLSVNSLNVMPFQSLYCNSLPVFPPPCRAPPFMPIPLSFWQSAVKDMHRPAAPETASSSTVRLEKMERKLEAEQERHQKCQKQLQECQKQLHDTQTKCDMRLGLNAGTYPWLDWRRVRDFLPELKCRFCERGVQLLSTLSCLHITVTIFCCWFLPHSEISSYHLWD